MAAIGLTDRFRRRKAFFQPRSGRLPFPPISSSSLPDKNETALAPVVYANGASIVVNPDPSNGQFSSLQVGLHEVLNRGRDAALITLVDRPPANAATVQTLRDSFEAAPQSVWALIPEFSGKHGHPFAVGREMMERFLREPVTGNAREVEHSLPGTHPVSRR